LLASGNPAVLAGDYNVVPTDADIYSTRSFSDNALLQPAPRAAYQSLLDASWTDALKSQSPEASLCTLWSYLRNRWPRDAGLRIDHLLLSPKIARRMRRAVRGLEGARDHAPAWVELKDGGAESAPRIRGHRRFDGSSIHRPECDHQRFCSVVKVSLTKGCSSLCAMPPMLRIDGCLFGFDDRHLSEASFASQYDFREMLASRSNCLRGLAECQSRTT
jgi:hypothetical protein